MKQWGRAREWIHVICNNFLWQHWRYSAVFFLFACFTDHFVAMAAKLMRLNCIRLPRLPILKTGTQGLPACLSICLLPLLYLSIRLFGHFPINKFSIFTNLFITCLAYLLYLYKNNYYNELGFSPNPMQMAKQLDENLQKKLSKKWVTVETKLVNRCASTTTTILGNLSTEMH